jgi:hypothetical protein
MWDRLLRAGRHVTAVGASDWHRTPTTLGAAAVRVFAEQRTEQAILGGIRRGRVIVMRDAQAAPPSVRAGRGSHNAGIGDSLRCAGGEHVTVQVAMPDLADGRADFVWNGDRVTSKRIADGATFTTPASAGYLRIHVYAADGSAVTVTNPVYVATR